MTNTNSSAERAQVPWSRPPVKLVGTDGNVFNLMARCTRALRLAGHSDKAKEMVNRIMVCGSYDDALRIMTEYCDVQ